MSRSSADWDPCRSVTSNAVPAGSRIWRVKNFDVLDDVMQPVRGPGDLRHDLERRRQERLEGVKVTISGSSVSQHLLGPAR